MNSAATPVVAFVSLETTSNVRFWPKVSVNFNINVHNGNVGFAPESRRPLTVNMQVRAYLGEL